MRQGLLRHLVSRCAVCHAWPAHAICERCVVRFAQPKPRCPGCALPLYGSGRYCGACLRTPPPVDLALCAVAYDYPWSELLRQFKFQEGTGWASHFAMLMRNAPWMEDALEQAELVLPMPLSEERLRWRGFNQSVLLARALTHRLAPGLVHENLLLKVRDTPAQSSLPRDERLLNLRHAFAFEPLQPERVRGRRVVLVDDVMTSGASLHACAEVLRERGAKHITALVFARTE
jgi:ComF family protein